MHPFFKHLAEHHGRFGDHFGGGGFMGGPRVMRPTKMLTSAELQLVILSLIAAEARHGYELIKALEEHSSGFYTPSPGMVYPALTYLEEVGYVTVEVDGNRKRYALAEAGRAQLDTERERVNLLFAKLEHLGRKMAFMRRAMAGQTDAADGTPDGGWLPEFVEARMALKAALFRKSAAAPDEQQRIAAILRRAAADIDGTPEA
jgi:DNA-binding PadR family transcriptional regulator